MTQSYHEWCITTDDEGTYYVIERYRLDQFHRLLDQMLEEDSDETIENFEKEFGDNQIPDVEDIVFPAWRRV